ncbi:hypothetical protein, partial [Peptoniphilus lacrimalis]|uniref:hypothetical protein n=1 Tax=Peptoniphilus lacrimalis TaxID=33031 RepID=UPI000587C757
VGKIHKQLFCPLISIHAPVKGATTFRVTKDENLGKISIHAPVKGATAFFRHSMTYKMQLVHLL